MTDTPFKGGDNLQNGEKGPRKRSNPSDEIVINIGLTVLWNPKKKTLDIDGFSIDPADELTIGYIGNLLGDNVVSYILNNMKPKAKIEGKV